MATNKNATIRYQALDKCFRNPGKRYYIDDLIEACNDALLDIDPKSTGVKRRQIYDDIKFMQDSQGFDAPIDTYKEGRRSYYRYTDSNFSINNQPLNQQEAQQLKESLLTLSRFKGMPQFEWVEELTTRLEHTFSLRTDKKVISFEENPFLEGLEHIGVLYNAIVNQQVLQITYQPFGKQETKFDLHPYFLKQYNNRWFLFGINTGYKNLTTVALDRIVHIQDSKTQYDKNVAFDFEELFEDVIGVTFSEEKSAEKVVLRIDKELWPYIKTKPIHGSQKKIEETTSYMKIQLKLVLNHELEALILSYGDRVTVEEPNELKSRLKSKIERLNTNYF